jgi:hypothetical protein
MKSWTLDRDSFHKSEISTFFAISVNNKERRTLQKQLGIQRYKTDYYYYTEECILFFGIGGSVISERRTGESYSGSYLYMDIRSFKFALLVKVNKFSMQHYMAESFNYLLCKISVRGTR